MDPLETDRWQCEMDERGCAVDADDREMDEQEKDELFARIHRLMLRLAIDAMDNHEDCARTACRRSGRCRGWRCIA